MANDTDLNEPGDYQSALLTTLGYIYEAVLLNAYVTAAAHGIDLSKYRTQVKADGSKAESRTEFKAWGYDKPVQTQEA
jgi:hypothetical protein